MNEDESHNSEPFFLMHTMWEQAKEKLSAGAQDTVDVAVLQALLEVQHNRSDIDVWETALAKLMHGLTDLYLKYSDFENTIAVMENFESSPIAETVLSASVANDNEFHFELLMRMKGLNDKTADQFQSMADSDLACYFRCIRMQYEVGRELPQLMESITLTTFFAEKVSKKAKAIQQRLASLGTCLETKINRLS